MYANTLSTYKPKMSHTKLAIDSNFLAHLNKIYQDRYEFMSLSRIDSIPWSGHQDTKITLEVWPYKNNTLGFIMCNFVGKTREGPADYHTAKPLDDDDFILGDSGW